MTEYKFFDGDEAHVSTFEFHQYRSRAHHLEEGVHRRRLEIAAEFAILAHERRQDAVWGQSQTLLTDLGCGDGGLLSLLKDVPNLSANGYDFTPANAAGWQERGVTARPLNFVDFWPVVTYADVYVATEVLEHLTDPHQMVQRIRSRKAQLVASSPRHETVESHDECHAWGWDMAGYAKMIEDEGFMIKEHIGTEIFQVVWAVPQ